MSNFKQFPPQQLPFNRKTKKWRKQVIDWADSKTFFNHNAVRNSVIHKKINYDLLNGKLHKKDLEVFLNPDSIQAGFIAENIQHYPIMNSKLNVLRGEEAKRVFDFKVIITNPNSISDIENKKKEEVFEKLKTLMTKDAQSEEEFNQELEKLNQYYTYEWQDMREVRANALINHYSKEYNIPLIFNDGFMDALTVGEEIYQCDIIGGEPTIERLNPLKVRVFRSGYSNKIEDADMIIIEDYWSPGKVIDTFYESLSPKDIKYIEKASRDLNGSATDSMDNIDESFGFINMDSTGIDFNTQDQMFFEPFGEVNGVSTSLLPFDMFGNIRVLKVYWKSRRRIKQVKSYNPETGEEEYNFYSENYVLDTDLGEEETIFYINEAWEGTKIGSEIYVNMRPRPVQYNRLSNPSRCHFGIVGSIYNLNENKPFSLVDMMKPYNYYYDAIHDRLNKLLAHNWGKIITLDLAKVPKGWEVEKWLYFAKTNNIAVVDSFKEGNIGASTGKLAGALNNNSTGVIDAEMGNSIQQQINLLEFIKMEMSEVAGISKQREGQISNRETVGGVERATLQSSHITEYLFMIHNDVKKRVVECFLETCKIGLKGRNKKFQYLLSDMSSQIMEIDGDEFADSDYGLVVDSSNKSQELNNKLDMLAQAALQNQALDFSTIMKLYGSSSLAEKQRMVEANEQKIQEFRQQEMQQNSQMQQQQLEANMQMKQEDNRIKEEANIRDNETKVLIAEINLQASNAEDDGIVEPEISEESKQNLLEKMREFDEKIKLDREKLELDRQKHQDDVKLKTKQLNNNTRYERNK